METNLLERKYCQNIFGQLTQKRQEQTSGMSDTVCKAKFGYEKGPGSGQWVTHWETKLAFRIRISMDADSFFNVNKFLLLTSFDYKPSIGFFHLYSFIRPI